MTKIEQILNLNNDTKVKMFKSPLGFFPHIHIDFFASNLLGAPSTLTNKLIFPHSLIVSQNFDVVLKVKCKLQFFWPLEMIFLFKKSKF